ncbi:hypothetical protein [Colwellia sp. TT2012]|uniref:hypothetical protein n=1 Tax=Colwellia sp. TT2012 TaxID=1720342 RepID=UPI00070C07F5|nr:hypothetical protein [Colwellia sp. TT2012]
MKALIKKTVTSYLFLSGVLVHIFVIALFVMQPFLFHKLTSKVTNYYYAWQKKQDYHALTQGKKYTLVDEINRVFSPWQAEPQSKVMLQNFEVNGIGFSDVNAAVSALKGGDELFIAAGTYNTPFTIRKSEITITGVGHVIFQRGVVAGKGFILSKGNDLTINNIECRDIAVRDGNGACVRHEGVNLTLNHVFFHSSQEGVLETARQAGVIKIINSRFERLGHNGQAHGVYTNKAELFIYQSLFIATKSEGHAIKARGKKLTIENSIIVSLSSDDSRLIDMPNGGELLVVNSLLGQGPNSVNGQMIGYGLEGMTHQRNTIKLLDNVVYLERLGSNYLLALPKDELSITLIQNNNLIIGKDNSQYKDTANAYFSDRAEIGLPLYPNLPKKFCDSWRYCPIN